MVMVRIISSSSVRIIPPSPVRIIRVIPPSPMIIG
jgi:hypothetical protein